MHLHAQWQLDFFNSQHSVTQMNGSEHQVLPEGVQRVKAAICQACEMCREVSQQEFPNSAGKVATHTAEIERIIGEA